MKEKKFIELMSSSYILSEEQQKKIYGGDPNAGLFDPEGEPAVCRLTECNVQSDCKTGSVCTSFEFCSPQKHCF